MKLLSKTSINSSSSLNCPNQLAHKITSVNVPPQPPSLPCKLYLQQIKLLKEILTIKLHHI
jgi:hypothetical protein